VQRMKRAGAVTGFFSVLVGVLTVLFPDPLLAAKGALHDRAVVMARQGSYDEALAILQQEFRASPADLTVVYDYLAVLSWAGRDGEVLPLLPRVAEDRAPAYVLEAAAKSLRNLKSWNWAEVLYRKGSERFPDRPAFPLGLVYTLADNGRLQEAAALAEKLIDRYPGRIEPEFAVAYVAVAGKDYMAALAAYQRILDCNPRNKEALRLQSLTLAALGAPWLAEEFAGREEGLLTPAERLRLRGDQAALAVRWGAYGSEEERERFADTDCALALLEDNRRQVLELGAEAEIFDLRTRFDRLVALRDRVRMQEAAEEYRALLDAGVDVPAYALRAAADALLYLERPEEAREVYQQVLAGQPGDVEAQLGLFYACIEMEDFAAAACVIEEARERQPVWLRTEGRRVPLSNPHRLEADLTAVVGLAFAGNYREAERRLTVLHEQAPANRDILNELAGVYADRGWHRRAEESYRLGLALEPRHLGLRTGRVGNLLDLSEFEQAGQDIAGLREVFPENKAVQRLERLWRAHNMRELRVSAESGWTSGGAFGSRDLTVEAALFSSPVFHHYRGFVAGYLAQGDFPGGEKTWQRYGAGIECRSRQLEGSAELTWNVSGGRKLGGRLAGTWLIDDNWSLPFSLEAFSRDTPLQAMKNGIRADAAEAGVSYRASESRNITLTAQIMDFSDGNFRYRVGGGLYQRLVTRPHYLLNGYLDLDTSGNSRSDAPYFNPDHDAGASLTLENDWLLWRRYQRSFRHRLAFTAGGYWQQGFGSAPVGGVRYEQVWEVSPRFFLLYGASWGHAVYDGDGENRLGLHLNLNWRF
jgi:biofilm PGA synthesis protein PgaA